MSIDTHHLWRHRGPAGILSIAQCHLTTPARVTIAGEKPAAGKVPRVRQVAYLVPRAHKPAVLDRVLDMENLTSALVFLPDSPRSVVVGRRASWARATPPPFGDDEENENCGYGAYRDGRVRLAASCRTMVRPSEGN